MDYVNKRLDLDPRGSSRLAPSYSNPDLATARRLSSLENAAAVAATSGVSNNIPESGAPSSPSSSSYAAAAAGLLALSSSQQQQQQLLGMAPYVPSSLMYNAPYPYPAMISPTISNISTNPAAAAAAAHAAAICNHNNNNGGAGSSPAPLNPLLLSHLIRHMPPSSPSSPSSPTSTSSFRKAQQSTTSSNSNSTTTQRRHNEHDKFAHIKFEDVVDDIYSLCKDQYGCRYLQRKLEEQNDEQRDIIFEQVFPHFIKLMTGNAMIDSLYDACRSSSHVHVPLLHIIDPFGNYLCQKLMERCTDEQRTRIVEQVSQDLVDISLNMHGTRAVQKMIEYITLPEQVCLTCCTYTSLLILQKINHVVVTLAPNVVTLIKDLNGNHVIQRCLHRMSSENKQFIYNAVSENCIEVATHRHGCCVLQRCIDYSSESQKVNPP